MPSFICVGKDLRKKSAHMQLESSFFPTFMIFIFHGMVLDGIKGFQWKNPSSMTFNFKDFEPSICTALINMSLSWATLGTNFSKRWTYLIKQSMRSCSSGPEDSKRYDTHFSKLVESYGEVCPINQPCSQVALVSGTSNHGCRLCYGDPSCL